MASLLRSGIPASRSAIVALALGSRGAFYQASRATHNTANANTAEERLAAAELAKKNRPSSPHLAIYQPQLTWYLSIAHRMTGVGVAMGFYGGALAYAAIPSLDSAAVLSAIAGTPLAVKIAAKMIVAYPVTFHVMNGVRHLVWDTGKALSLKGVYNTGYIVIGASTVASLALAVM